MLARGLKSTVKREGHVIVNASYTSVHKLSQETVSFNSPDSCAL